MKTLEIRYEEVLICPLCGGTGRYSSKLSLDSYYFGEYSIPLPDSGIILRECIRCSLLFKSHIPSQESMVKIYQVSATGVWRSKPGLNLAFASIENFLNCEQRVLEIGAANGDLLAQVKEKTACVSALDIVPYPKCRDIVNGEYIIGSIEDTLSCPENKYDLVLAFDVFEHFSKVAAAISNISDFISYNGLLIVETGDWRAISYELSEWYYVNLFEHNVFWTRDTLIYLSEKHGFTLVYYQPVLHKSIRRLNIINRLALKTVVSLAKYAIFQKGMLFLGKGDAKRFIPPTMLDHMFVVLSKSTA